jgi:hypothetical protein
MTKYKDTNRETTGRGVYVFYNTITDVQLFVNAEDADKACFIFDSCGFSPRSHWKIFLELAQQPFDGPKKKKPKKPSKFANRVEIH